MAQNVSFGGPRGPRRAPEDQIWSQLPPAAPPGLNSWLPHTLALYRPSSEPPAAPKRASFGPKCLFWGAKFGSKIFLSEYSHVGCRNHRNGMPWSFNDTAAVLRPSMWKKQPKTDLGLFKKNYDAKNLTFEGGQFFQFFFSWNDPERRSCLLIHLFQSQF